MNQESHNPFEPMQTAALSAAERADIRRALVAHMTANPRRSGIMAVLTRRAFVYGAAGFVLLAGGTAALAQHAMPGSLLYPVRLAVNDRVAVALAGNEDAQLDAELSQIGRTIDDEENAEDGDLYAEELADGGVNAPHDDEADQIGNDLKNAQKDLQDIEQDGPPED